MNYSPWLGNREFNWTWVLSRRKKLVCGLAFSWIVIFKFTAGKAVILAYTQYLLSNFCVIVANCITFLTLYAPIVISVKFLALSRSEKL